jgi:peptidoglycan hydrolase CwlO-like protein
MKRRYLLQSLILLAIVSSCAQKPSNEDSKNNLPSAQQVTQSTTDEVKQLNVEPIDQLEKDLESSLEKEVSRIEELDSIKAKDQKDFDPIEEEMEEDSEL